MDSIGMTNEAYNQEGLIIDLKDMLAGVFLRWKTILFCMILSAAVTCGLAFLHGFGVEEITNEDIEFARTVLASDQADDVDRIFLQYKAYQNYQRQMKDYYAKFITSDLDLENMVRLSSQYQITSSMENLDRVLSTFTLTETDYDALRKIEPDEEFGAPIYKRIIFSTVTNTRVTLSNFAEETAAPFTYLLITSVYGKSEAQCQEMLQIIANAVEREADSLRIIDHDLTCSFLGSEYSHNTVDYVKDLQKSSIDSMTIAETELNNMTTKISKLSSEQRAYYNLLVKQVEQEYQPEEHFSWKKWTAIGALLGAILVVGVFFAIYLMDGTVKISKEVDSLFHTHTLQRFSLSGKKNLFGKLAASLSGSELTDPTVKVAMLAADLQVLLDKAGHKRLFLVCDEADLQAVAIAKEVSLCVANQNSSIHISFGNPIASVRELEQLAATDDAVIFTELKHSRRKALNRWRELCVRYCIPVVGSVSVETCW